MGKDANGNEIPESGQEQTPPQVPPSGTFSAGNQNPPTQQEKSTDWEQQYKGLQGTYNKLHANNADLAQKYTTLTEEHEKVKQDLVHAQSELSKLQASLGDKDKALSERQNDVDAKARQYERLKTVAAKYPMLVNLELNGLIPDVAPELLDEKLQVLNETIVKQIDSKASDTLKNTPPGSTQFTTQTPPVNDVESVYERLNLLAGSRDPKDQAEFEKLSQIYIELKNKK